MADNMLQIHELVSLGRDLTGTDVLAVDTGALTAKVDYSSLKQVITADSVSTTQFNASAVKFSAAQTLTDAQKVQARNNISAASTADLTAETAAREAADEAINESLATKADADGSYDEMIVGSAEQLISTELTEEKVPYTLRASGGAADIGNRETDMLVGGTIAWNQLLPVVDNSWTYSSDWSFSDGQAALQTSASQTIFLNLYNQISAQAGHKYMVGVSVLSVNSSATMVRLAGDPVFGNYPTAIKNITTAGRYEGLIENTTTQTLRIGIKIQLRQGQSINISCANFVVFDLTQMFGSTIADYIYSLEQANAGAGVAWFRALFRGDYYAYNAGELMSVQAASHNMVGFNAYNNATGNAHVIGGVQYKITGAYTALALNGTAITPDSSGLFTPTASGILTVTGGDATTTCVNLSDPSRNGEYEPYALHAYPLDDTLTLRGIPKLDANNALYYDGDTYASDGTVTKRYGVVDLGTLNWNLITYQSITYVVSQGIKDIVAKPLNDNVAANVCTSRYTTIERASMSTTTDKVVSVSVNGYINIIDSSYTTAADFKAAMSGVMFVYELATPTTETAATYRNPQIVDPFGTEEYVDAAVTAGTRDVAVPVGHVTQYMADLRGKLQKIPNLPTAGGTYVLKVTVTGGVPTYSWQAQ